MNVGAAGSRQSASGDSSVRGAEAADRFIFPQSLLESAWAKAESQAIGSEAATDAAWWLVYVKSRQEKRLSLQLSAMEVPHYLPIHRREAMTRGRVRYVEEPIFRGYLFLLADEEQRRSALTTNRISSTQRVGDPARLQFELSQIRRSIAGGARLTIEAQIEEGDWVRIKSGVHAGLEGRVLRREKATRLLLAVNFLQRGASFEVHESLLETVDPPEISDATPAIEVVGRRGY